MMTPALAYPGPVPIASRLPSGDHALYDDLGVVSRRGLLPSLAMVQTLSGPARLEKYDSVLPSGDQRGSRSIAVSDVSCRSPLPSARATYRSPSGCVRV